MGNIITKRWRCESVNYVHDDVIKWNHFPRYWPFVENSPVAGELPAQRPVTRSFDIFFDLRLNKRLSKQSWGWWFETLSLPVWRHSNAKRWRCGPVNYFQIQIRLQLNNYEYTVSEFTTPIPCEELIKRSTRSHFGKFTFWYSAIFPLITRQNANA